MPATVTATPVQVPPPGGPLCTIVRLEAALSLLPKEGGQMAFEVPDLPYDYNALEPHIDEQTMRVHHDKHHQAYVDKANAALEGTEWADKDVKNAGVGQFGSGWAWLIHDGSGLAVVSTANQDSPISDGSTPIIGCDVWEHAYYLNYQNKRPDYLDAWWNVVNWAKAGEIFAAAGG